MKNNLYLSTLLLGLLFSCSTQKDQPDEALINYAQELDAKRDIQNGDVHLV